MTLRVLFGNIGYVRKNAGMVPDEIAIVPG
jgi:hypothetical protein